MASENDSKMEKRAGPETTAWRKKKSKKIKIEVGVSSPSSHWVGLLLASAARIRTAMAQSTAVGLQNYILSMLRNSSLDPSLIENVLLQGFLPALPAFLRCSLQQVSLRSVESLGTLVLWSYEMNAKVSGDSQIVSALVAIIVKTNNDFSRSACNALMDLATTSCGRETLRENGAIEQLFLLFCQVSRSLYKGEADKKYLLKSSGMDFKLEVEEIDFLMLVLDAITILVFDDNNNHMALVSKDLALVTLSFMQEIWTRLQMQNLDCKSKLPNSLSGKSCSLAKMIFRLAIEQTAPDCSNSFINMVKTSIFGDADTCFEHFTRHHWECCPTIIRKPKKRQYENGIISLLFEATQKQNIDDILDQILTGMVSCPPVSADNLDVIDFLREIQDSLGYPMVYGQDIRLIKSTTEEVNDKFSKLISETNEQHFFTDLSHTASAEMPNFVYLQDCKQAYEMGYTIAIRGMEFRSHNISEVADALAMVFGQVSVGANLYLTPPSSQGLSVHYDDHCVLVFQLSGNKRWVLLPPEKMLPRLYEPRSAVHNVQNNLTDLKEILLMEGDILYIPRGFPHAAHTTNDGSVYFNQMEDKSEILDLCFCGSDTRPFDANIDEQKYGLNNIRTSQTCCINNSSYNTAPNTIGLENSQRFAAVPTRDGYSLHLTFGVEVEPPFEWEGIFHIALHCWEKYQKLEDIKRIYNSEKLFFLAVQMLHIAIRILGDSCSLLRKACTVAAPAWHYDRSNKDEEVEIGLDMSCNTDSPGHHQELSSEEFFSNLIGMVRSRCKFADAYKLVEVNASNLDCCDILPWMKWLRHLSPEDTNSNNPHGWTDPSEHLRKIFQPDQLNVLDCERVFSQVKSRFSNEVNFQETFKGFEFLLEKYRHARKQFINGMLALHSGSTKSK